MITRGYVSAIKPGYVRVRIPMFNGINSGELGYTEEDSLPWAVVSTIPGVEEDFRKDDVVIVAFQDNDIGRPIVLGHLKSAIRNPGYADITLSTLNVQNRVELPKDIKIGTLSYEQLQLLDGLSPITNDFIDGLFV